MLSVLKTTCVIQPNHRFSLREDKITCSKYSMQIDSNARSSVYFFDVTNLWLKIRATTAAVISCYAQTVTKSNKMRSVTHEPTYNLGNPGCVRANFIQWVASFLLFSPTLSFPFIISFLYPSSSSLTPYLLCDIIPPFSWVWGINSESFFERSYSLAHFT
jgi:hypothetical protein